MIHPKSSTVATLGALCMFAGMSCPQTKLTICGDVGDVKGLCVTIDPRKEAAELPATIEGSDFGRFFCGGDWKVLVKPSATKNVTLDGRPLVPCEAPTLSAPPVQVPSPPSPSVTTIAASDPDKPIRPGTAPVTVRMKLKPICSSEESNCVWPEIHALEAGCYDPGWACKPWEEAVRLGIAAPDTPFPAIALRDPRLTPCWAQAVGANMTPAVTGDVTGPFGKEWELWWYGNALPALMAAGKLSYCGTRQEALMATYAGPFVCEAFLLINPTGPGLSPQHPFPESDRTRSFGLRRADKKEDGAVLGCSRWFLNTPPGGEPQPTPTPVPSPTPVPTPTPTPTPIPVPCPSCSDVCPPIPVSEISSLVALGISPALDAQSSEIARLRGAIESLKCGERELPKECEDLTGLINGLQTTPIRRVHLVKVARCLESLRVER